MRQWSRQECSAARLSARVKVDANRDKDAALNLHLDASGLDLAAILAEAGIKREVHGGKTSVNADIAVRGGSLHQWASSASGIATVIVGQTTIGHPTDNADPNFNKLAEAVNPFRKVDPSTEVQCAVIRLPLASGIARVDPARHRADIRPPMTANLGFIADATEARAHELSPKRLGDRTAKTGLANAGRADEAENRAAHPRAGELTHRQVLENPFLYLLQAVVILVEHAAAHRQCCFP